MALTVHTPDPSDEIENTHRAQAKNKIYVCCPTPVSPSARSPASNHSERNCHDKARARHTCQEEKACRGRVAGQGSLAGGGAREKGCAPRGQSARARLSARGKEGAGDSMAARDPGVGPATYIEARVAEELSLMMLRLTWKSGAYVSAFFAKHDPLSAAYVSAGIIPPPLFSFLSPR